MNSISTVLRQFDRLDRAAIDTSSLIYLNHINLLDTTSHALQLMTVEGVVKEFGNPDELTHIDIIKLTDINPQINATINTTDQYLAETVRYFRVPVISEDKKILMQVKRLGLPFFNTLMIMNFLLYKQRIDQRRYQKALGLLRDKAFYDGFIFGFGKQVFEKITQHHEKI